MSLLDRVGKLEEQVAARLKELEPVVREYDQLRRVAQRLGLDYSAAASKPESEPIQASPASTGRRAAAKKRAASRSRGTASPRAARAKRAAKSPTAAGGTPRTAPAETDAAGGKPAAAPPAARQATTRAKPRSARVERAAKSPTAADATPRAPRTAPAETDAAAPSKPATAPPAASHSTTPAKRSSARNRAATGRRFDDVLRVVSANPGITLREIGQQLGMDAAWLYRVAKRLADEGRLRRDNTRLYAVEPGGAAGPNRG